MHGNAGRLAHGHQARHGLLGVRRIARQNLAVIVRGDAAHVVMHRRQDRDRLARHIHAGEDLGQFGNARQPLMQHLGVEVFEVQVDVVLVLAHAAALADLDGHRARDDIARGQVLGGRRIALHEALALAVGEIAALAARTFGDEAARAIDAGGVELHELHVLAGKPGAQHHGIAVARAGVGRGRREIRATIASGRQDRLMRPETMDRSIFHHMATTPRHSPFSMIRSSAKYSMKKSAEYCRLWP